MRLPIARRLGPRAAVDRAPAGVQVGFDHVVRLDRTGRHRAGLERPARQSRLRRLLRQPGTAVDPAIHGQLRPVLRPGSEEGFEDATVPPAGDGYVYLAQGENFDCGMGSLGLTSAEIPRSNPDALACTGHSFTDVFASSETPISGTVTGSLTDLSSSDNVYETIEEVKIGGCSPSLCSEF